MSLCITKQGRRFRIYQIWILAGYIIMAAFFGLIFWFESKKSKLTCRKKFGVLLSNVSVLFRLSHSVFYSAPCQVHCPNPVFCRLMHCSSCSLLVYVYSEFWRKRSSIDIFGVFDLTLTRSYRMASMFSLRPCSLISEEKLRGRHFGCWRLNSAVICPPALVRISIFVDFLCPQSALAGFDRTIAGKLPPFPFLTTWKDSLKSQRLWARFVNKNWIKIDPKS